MVELRATLQSGALHITACVCVFLLAFNALLRVYSQIVKDCFET